MTFAHALHPLTILSNIVFLNSNSKIKNSHNIFPTYLLAMPHGCKTIPNILFHYLKGGMIEMAR